MVFLGQALEVDDSCDGFSARWTDLGWVAVGSCFHPHVFLRVVNLFVVILGGASGASSGI